MLPVLGIDCGGSATQAVLVDGGKPVWTGAGGPANVSSLPLGLLRESVEAAIDGCPSPRAVCGAFAGLVTNSQKQGVEGFLRDLFPEAEVAAVPDFEAALVACGGGTDVCVLAGTGSLVCSFGHDGRLFRSGGKGHLLGDEGSAFQYGRDALLHFLEGPPDDVSDTLRRAIQDSFGSLRKPEILAKLYGTPQASRLLAGLFSAFADDAENQAIYALKSLRIQSAKLSHVVSIHLRQYHPSLKAVKIGCQGGVWTRRVICKPFTQQLGIWCRVSEIDVDFDLPAPVYGAAEIAGRLV